MTGPSAAEETGPRVLHPARGRSILLLFLSVPMLLLGIGVLSTTSGPVLLLGVGALLIGAFALWLGLTRLLSRRCFALELDDERFVMRDVRGRVWRESAWVDVARFTVQNGPGPWGAGTELRVGWLCFDGTPGAEKRFRRDGKEIDGYLLDSYARSYEEMLAIMMGYAERAHAPAARTGA